MICSSENLVLFISSVLLSGLDYNRDWRKIRGSRQNLQNRPQHQGSAMLRRGATAGHLALYILMIVVPSLAIARAFGNGRGFSAYGVPNKRSGMRWTGGRIRAFRDRSRIVP